MTQPRLRRVLAVAVAAAALSLAACAPPGQEGQPGVAAVYNGTTFTNSDLDAVHEAWRVGTNGNDVPRRQQILTIELMREPAIEAVRELGYTFSDQEISALAAQWLEYLRVDAEPTGEFALAVEGVYAIAALVALDPSMQVIYGIAVDVEESAVLSPRSGSFTANAFMKSVEDARTAAIAQDLGSRFYIEFQHVNGFERVATPWIDNG
ncbi:MAG: hypothetical protein CVT64_07215 [Actinobacteria bacterium HGW-Actinobacteria-4]|nr:MAG: hypothetical protein CVT64_07215 [Actinobacteria bacterium HGW-Actinobacteria-4]